MLTNIHKLNGPVVGFIYEILHFGAMIIREGYYRWDSNYVLINIIKDRVCRNNNDVTRSKGEGISDAGLLYLRSFLSTIEKEDNKDPSLAFARAFLVSVAA